MYIITISFACSAVLSRVVPWNKSHSRFPQFYTLFSHFVPMTNRRIHPAMMVNIQRILQTLNKRKFGAFKVDFLLRRNELQNNLNLCLVTKCSNVPFLMFVLSKEKLDRSYLESLIRSDLFTNPHVYKYLTSTSQLYKDYQLKMCAEM